MENIDLVNVELTVITQNLGLTVSETPCQPAKECSPCSPSDCHPGGREPRCCPNECIAGPKCYPTGGNSR